jgi:membrane protein required for colicin V production
MAGEMQGADWVIVAIVGVSLIVGAFRGFVREAVSLLAWLLGIWLAWRHSQFLYPYLGGVIESPLQQAWAARVIMLVLVLLAGALVGVILGWVTRTAAGLSTMDRVLGLLFGATRAAVIVGLGAIAGQALELDGESWWKRSMLIPYAKSVGDWLEGYAGESKRLAEQAFGAALPVEAIEPVEPVEPVERG